MLNLIIVKITWQVSTDLLALCSYLILRTKNKRVIRKYLYEFSNNSNSLKRTCNKKLEVFKLDRNVNYGLSIDRKQFTNLQWSKSVSAILAFMCIFAVFLNLSLIINNIV